MKPKSYLTPYEPSSIPIPEPKYKESKTPTKPPCHLIPVEKEKNNSGIDDLFLGFITLLFWFFIFLMINISPELLKVINSDSGSEDFLTITALWFIIIPIFAYQIFPIIISICIILNLLF